MDNNKLLLIFGLALIVSGAFYPMITLFVDTSPPFYDLMGMTPNTTTYVQLSALQVAVGDSESGVKSVTCTVDGTLYTLDLAVGTYNDGTWYKYLSTPVTTSGNHTFNWVFKNNAGLQSDYGGTFTIYRDLQGVWYVNNVAVNSTAQTVYATSTTVPFKFVKSSGVEDSKVTCTASWSGAASGSKTLTLTATNTWEGSVTFTALGQYSITLKADDGTKQVTFSIVSIDFGGSQPIQFDPQYLIIAAGVVLAAFAYMRRKKRAAQ